MKPFKVLPFLDYKWASARKRLIAFLKPSIIEIDMETLSDLRYPSFIVLDEAFSLRI